MIEVFGILINEDLLVHIIITAFIAMMYVILTRK